MIGGVKGPERAGKDAWMAIKAPSILTEQQVKQVYANCTLNGLPVPTYTADSREILDIMFYCFENGETQKAFIFSEAHKIFNARNWEKWDKRDQERLSQITQIDKLHSVLLYNFHEGYGEDATGVDKMVRTATRHMITINNTAEQFERHDKIDYTWSDRGQLIDVVHGKPVYREWNRHLFNVSKEYWRWDSYQRIK